MKYNIITIWSCKQIYRGQFFYVIVGGTERRQSDFLWELRKSRISKQRYVTQQFVTNVRFWCIQRSAMMSNVLGRMEHPEGQSSQKVSGREQPTDRSQSKSGTICKKIVRLWQLVWWKIFEKSPCYFLIFTFQNGNNFVQHNIIIIIKFFVRVNSKITYPWENLKCPRIVVCWSRCNRSFGQVRETRDCTLCTHASGIV